MVDQDAPVEDEASGEERAGGLSRWGEGRGDVGVIYLDAVKCRLRIAIYHSLVP